MTLRDYQEIFDDKIDLAFDAGHNSVLATMATGGGKSVMMSHRAGKVRDLSVIMAHRLELTYQLAMSLGRDGIEHRICAPDAVSNFIIAKQIEIYGKKFVYAGAQHIVASVDTLLARADQLGAWPSQVVLTQPDEAHHVLGAKGDPKIMNKWGRACRMFPKSKYLGWTATAGRPDRQPLSSSFDVIVPGPTARDLLASGDLCPYRVFGPPASIDMGGARATPGGDWSKHDIDDRSTKSTITGDLLRHYVKYAPGRIGIGFMSNVVQTKEICERFIGAGIPSAWMSAKETDDKQRVKTMDALRAGDIKVLFNVDLLGEGVDVPRCDVILDGRPTMSIVRYLQVFGRLLRNFPGKQEGIYVDAVGNVVRHGLPETWRDWTLDGTPKAEKPMLKSCTTCFLVYSRLLSECPYCGARPVVAVGGRIGPEQVDGDLLEFDAETLARLRGDADRVMAAAPAGAPSYVVKNINERFVAQKQLRDAMAWWVGMQTEMNGHTESASYRSFYLKFGIDTATAQGLGRPQAEKLTALIWEDMNNERPRPINPPLWAVEDDVWKKSGRKNGVSNPAYNKQMNRWTCNYRVNGVKKAAHSKSLDQCQIYCDWVNNNPNQILPDHIYKLKRARKGESKYSVRLSHNRKTKIFYGPTQEKAEKKANEYRKLHKLPARRAADGEGKYRSQVLCDGERSTFYGPTQEIANAKRDEYKRQNGLI